MLENASFQGDTFVRFISDQSLVRFLDVQNFYCMRAKKAPNDATCQSWNFLEYAQIIHFQNVTNNFNQNCTSGKKIIPKLFF